jgi:hypothetical protein
LNEILNELHQSNNCKKLQILLIIRVDNAQTFRLKFPSHHRSKLRATTSIDPKPSSYKALNHNPQIPQGIIAIVQQSQHQNTPSIAQSLELQLQKSPSHHRLSPSVATPKDHNKQFPKDPNDHRPKL